MDTLATDTTRQIQIGTDSLSTALATPLHGPGHSAMGADMFSLLGPGVLLGTLAVVLLALLFYIVVGWKIFVKAGKPGWASLIPIYNYVVLLEIAGRPLWWLLLMFIPLVNLVIGIVLVFDVARKFGKGVLFGLGLIFLWFLFTPILAFDDSRYDPNA
jgi:hypothetical protein